MRGASSLAAATALTLAAGPQVKIHGAENIKRHLQQKKRVFYAHGSIAQVNRNTDKPHEHAREIARRRRQEARS